MPTRHRAIPARQKMSRPNVDEVITRPPTAISQPATISNNARSFIGALLISEVRCARSALRADTNASSEHGPLLLGEFQRPNAAEAPERISQERDTYECYQRAHERLTVDEADQPRWHSRERHDEDSEVRSLLSICSHNKNPP